MILFVKTLLPRFDPQTQTTGGGCHEGRIERERQRLFFGMPDFSRAEFKQTDDLEWMANFRFAHADFWRRNIS
jgi:hypothetical protein